MTDGPPRRLQTIVEEAAILAAHMPGFGDPFSVRVDVVDDAIRSWVRAHPTLPSVPMSPRDIVDARMKEMADGG